MRILKRIKRIMFLNEDLDHHIVTSFISFPDCVTSYSINDYQPDILNDFIGLGASRTAD